MKVITKDIPILEEFVVESVFSDEEATMSDSNVENNEESASDIESSSSQSIDELSSVPSENFAFSTFKIAGLCSELERFVVSEKYELDIIFEDDTELNFFKKTTYSGRSLFHDSNALSNGYAAEAVDDMRVHVLKEVTITLNHVQEQSIQFSIGFFRQFDTQTCNDPLPDQIVDFESQVKYVNQSEGAPNFLLYSTYQRAVKIMRIFDILFKEDNQQIFINLIASFDELDFGNQLPYGNSGRVPEMSWLMGSSFRYIGISMKAWLIAIIKMIREQMFKVYSIDFIFAQPSLFTLVEFYLKQENYIVTPNAWWSDVVTQTDIFISLKYLFILDCVAHDNFVEQMKRFFAEYIGESNDAVPSNAKDIKQIEAIQIIMGMLSVADAMKVEADLIARPLADEEVSVGNITNQSAMPENTFSIAETNTADFIDDDGAGSSI